VVISYPLPLLSAIVALVLMLWENHTINNSAEENNYFRVRLFLECLGGMLLFLAADIVVRWHQLDRYKQVGLYLTIICVLGIHFYSINPLYFQSDGVFFSRYIIFFICYFLVLSLSGYMHYAHDALLWQFNYRLLVTLAQSIAYSVVLLMGVLAAVWAIENLFGLTFQSQWYGDIVLFVLLVVHTIIFLVLFPSESAFFQNQTSYPQWLRVFAQYIVLPLVLIYGSLLYVYVLKILLTQKVPNGWVCIPILLYSAAGLLAFSLLFPIQHDRNNKTVFNFMRYFFYTLFPLLTLYFIALSLRIGPYGITENRYILGILGVWLSSLALYWIFKKEAPLMLIPQSLLFFLFLSVVGPMGMYQVSERSQSKRLHRLLIKNHFIENNRWSFKRTSTDTLSSADAESIRSAFKFLQERDALMAIHPWLQPVEQAWLTNQLKNKQSKEAVTRIQMAMNINPIQTNTEDVVSFKNPRSFGNEQSLVLPTGGQLIHVNWYQQQSESTNSGSWPAEINQGILRCRVNNMPHEFNLNAYFAQLNQFKQYQQDSLARADAERGTLLPSQQPLHELILHDSLTQLTYPNGRLFVNQINVYFNLNNPTTLMLDAYLWFETP